MLGDKVKGSLLGLKDRVRPTKGTKPEVEEGEEPDEKESVKRDRREASEAAAMEVFQQGIKATIKSQQKAALEKQLVSRHLTEIEDIRRVQRGINEAAMYKRITGNNIERRRPPTRKKKLIRKKKKK